KLHCQTLVSTSETAYGTTTVLKITRKTRFYEAVDYQNAKKNSKKKAVGYLTGKAGNYCFFWVENGKIIRMYYGLEQFVG
ncbi:MAG: hypothetical protein MR357_09380, partial [Anaeroplasma sp.]|nr:hypothetical protein [Anaeroplasma sp.]